MTGISIIQRAIRDVESLLRLPELNETHYAALIERLQALHKACADSRDMYSTIKHKREAIAAMHLHSEALYKMTEANFILNYNDAEKLGKAIDIVTVAMPAFRLQDANEIEMKIVDASTQIAKMLPSRVKKETDLSSDIINELSKVISPAALKSPDVLPEVATRLKITPEIELPPESDDNPGEPEYGSPRPT